MRLDVCGEQTNANEGREGYCNDQPERDVTFGRRHRYLHALKALARVGYAYVPE